MTDRVSRKVEMFSLYFFQYTNKQVSLPLINTYFSREAIITKLIAMRCREAEKKQKHIVVHMLASGSVHIPLRTDLEQALYDIFPPRRQWVHLGSRCRKDITPIAKNRKNLWLTIQRETASETPHPEWYNRLMSFVDRIQKIAADEHFAFSKPVVSVIEKKRDSQKNRVICRPICSFKTIEERVIASIYNRMLTELFDPYFYSRSFAFRVHSHSEVPMAHLKAVREIKVFRVTHSEPLWVAECDMKKFYDTIDHDVIKQRAACLLQRCKRDGRILPQELNLLRRVLFSYVNCFAFYKDVFAYNKRQDDPIWKHINLGGLKERIIDWVQSDFEHPKELGWRYRTKRHVEEQLGVPQGCALSGLIANMVMDSVDWQLRSYWESNPNLMYVRFCDDMIMIGTNWKQVSDAFEEYKQCVRKLHLFAHKDETLIQKQPNAFWNGKTRGPYAWGRPTVDVHPWITFVGYDIRWNADTRIRRSTLHKEIEKQYNKLDEVRTVLVGNGRRTPRYSRGYIEASLKKRLISMSVGRVTLWNYVGYKNTYSWASAFTELTDNKWSRAQMRLLDRHRNQMMHRLHKILGMVTFTGKEKHVLDSKRGMYHPYYGKPFSYYGQVLGY